MPMTVPNETIFHQKKRFQKVQKNINNYNEVSSSQKGAIK